MQGKVQLFDALPQELQIKTAQKLSTRDLATWAQTSKYYFALFKPIIDVRKLLHHVVHGKHDVVQLILINDIRLMFQRDKVTDCSGREFESVSGFEYTLWALDKHMWTTMIACIPQNEEGRKVFTQLIKQYNKVNTDGVTYRLNEKTITEQHFDFKNTIIKELQTQVDSIKPPEAKNWDAIDNQWQKGVSSAQKLLPMHVVHEYCSDEPFYPIPKFITQPKSSTQFYNWTTNNYGEWFNVSSKFDQFAIYKGAVWAAGGEAGWAWGANAFLRGPYDLDAMKTLFKVRTSDLINLKSQLEKQANLDYHHQVIPICSIR